MIKTVDEKNIDIAASIHSEACQESHKSFCSPEFVGIHTQEHQKEYLLEKMKKSCSENDILDVREELIVVEKMKGL